MKKLLALLLTLVMILTLAACGQTEPTPDTTPADNTPTNGSSDDVQPATPDNTVSDLPDGPVQIELWSDWNTSAEVLANAAAKFEAAYSDKGYTVVVNQFSGSQRNALLSAAVETNTLPALFLSAWFTTADYVHQGLVADISDIAATVKDDMFTNAYESTVINGNSYMIGLYQSYFGFVYNADLLRAAGLDSYVPEDPYEIAIWTVEDMENEILPKLAASMEGTEKYPIGFFAASEQGDTFMLNWLTMLGGKMWDNGYSVAGDDSNTVAALEKMISWTENGWTNSNVVTKDGSEVTGEFKNQVSAFSSGQFTTYTSALASMENGEIEPFEVRIAAVPVEYNGENTCTLANYVYGACVMNNGHEDQMAVAKEFIRWILSDEETLKTINAETIPTLRSINTQLEADMPIYAALAEVEPYIWDFTGGVAGYVSTRSLLYPQLQAAFGGTKTAAEALADYTAEANEVIQEYMDNSVVLN